MTSKEQLCMKCQLCCKVLHFRIADDILNAEFFMARGIKVMKVDNVGSFVEIPCDCQHLTAFGCKDYFNRPVACKMFDGSKNELLRERCLWK